MPPPKALSFVFLAAALLGLACSAAVQAGLPPLTNGCQKAADCASAGAAYQCVDGGCQLLACTCDRGCPPGLACFTQTSPYGQCLATDAGTPCVDAG